MVVSGEGIVGGLVRETRAGCHFAEGRRNTSSE